jgi:DNA-binding LytR/AlgR family response regulator
MKALIVDDEPIARQILRELLEGFPGVEVAGEASTGVEALDAMQDLAPDIILLDLQMPDLDGFGVARGLRGGVAPVIIFVTAYEQHALEAFNQGAVDYLLKPVRLERLATAIEKARAQLKGRVAAPASASLPRKIVGRMGQDQYLLDPAEVVAFVADGELVFIVTAAHRYFANQSLRAIEEKLPGSDFRRVHRRAIVNTAHIRRISPLSSKRWLLRMSNGSEVVVSKRMAGAIRQEMNW